MKRLLAVLAACLMAAAIRPPAAQAEAGPHLVIDGREVRADTSGLLLLHNRLYAPVRNVGEWLGAQVEWDDATSTATLQTDAGDEISIAWGSYKIGWNGTTYINDAPAESPNRTSTYLPLRTIAEALHTRVEWDGDTQTAALTRVPVYTAVEGDSWESVAARFGLDAALLKERNGGADLKPGMAVRTVIPEFMANQQKLKDQYLLAKIIDVEAGNEPMDGQIAVGDVILNRVKDERFPDTIHDVIFAPHQFPPALNGELDDLVPKPEAMDAAGRALGGEDLVGDAVYFYNPNVDANRFFASLKTVANIGSHRFAK